MPTTPGPVPEDEQALAEEFKFLTDDSDRIKAEYAANAARRREVAVALRAKGWSFRKIGDLAEISGQRVDSIIKIGTKLEQNAEAATTDDDLQSKADAEKATV